MNATFASRLLARDHLARFAKSDRSQAGSMSEHGKPSSCRRHHQAGSASSAELVSAAAVMPGRSLSSGRFRRRKILR